MHARKWLFAVLAVLLTISPVSMFAARGHSSGSHHKSSSSSAVPHPKPVHVHGYTKKNGTHVAPYNRALPGHAPRKSH